MNRQAIGTTANNVMVAADSTSAHPGSASRQRIHADADVLFGATVLLFAKVLIACLMYPSYALCRLRIQAVKHAQQE